MNRAEREARTLLTGAAVATCFALLPVEGAVIGTVAVLLAAAVGSVIYAAVTFDRHVTDALRLVQAGGAR